MNELQQVLNNIKQDKNTNLLPGNLRDNVTCLGVEGTAEVPIPIYTTTDYRTVNIPSPSSQYTKIYHLYRLDDYLIVSWKSSSYGSNYYLYKKDMGGYTLLGDTKCGSRTSYDGYPVIIGYNDKYVYIVQAQRNSDNCYIYPFNLETNTAESAISEYQSRSIADFVYSQKDGYAISNRTGSGYLFKLNMNETPVTLDRLIQIPSNSYVYNKHQLIFGDSNILTKVNISDSSTVTTNNMGKRIYGVNYYGTKIFFEDGVYQLSEQLTVSQKLGDFNISTTSTEPIFPLNEKYYVRYNTVQDKATIYEFNEDTNLFTELETVNSGDISGYAQSPDLYYGNYVYDFIQGDTLIGYTVGGNNLYINADRSITTSSILNGYQAYNAQGSPIVGTMPNNGELNITPTTENQNIPEGYTSGGTVLGDENLKSENIKKDVSIFGVTGSLESSLGGVKLFETEEEMQADETAKEGDLAIVYKNEIQNMTVDTQTQYITFPETVVLPDAITSDYRCTYKYIDDTPGSFSVRLDDNTFSFSKRGTPRINITYTSVDGITYNRDEFTINTFEELTNPVDLDGVIHINLNTQWNDNFGYFMQIGGMTFKGLYNYGEIIHNDYIQLSPISSVSFDYENKEVSNINYTGEVIGEPISIEKVKSIYNSISEDIGDLDLSPQYEIFLNKSQELYLALGVNNHEVRYFYTTTDCQPLGFGESINSSLGMYVYRIDLENNSYELVDSVNGTGASAYSYIPYDDILTIPIMIRTSSTIPQIPTSWRIIDSSSTGATNLYLDDYIGAYPLYKSDEYQLAPTQLNATSEYVYEKEFYGKNGVETGTLGTPDNSFADTNAEIVYKIQNQYENMEPRVLTDDDKTIDKNMYFIPVKKDGTPLLDTSSVITMEDMFNGCTNLTEIPLLNTSSAVNMQSMFMGCTNLQNISDLDTSKATNMSYMFHGCTNLATIPLLDTSKVTDIRSMFENCEHLMTVPNLNTSSATNMYSLFSGCASLTSIPLLDASNVTDVAYMFAACTNLVTIPQLDTSKVTNMMYMFMECTNLSDDSLNNVLAMCANATLYTGTKTLKYIGISEEQATKCTTLSNYEMFTSAGWTTGY